MYIQTLLNNNNRLLLLPDPSYLVMLKKIPVKKTNNLQKGKETI